MKTNMRLVPLAETPRAVGAYRSERPKRLHPMMGKAPEGTGPLHASKAHQDPATAKDESSVDGSRRPLRVMIVEDEVIIAMELEMILEELEAEVVGIAMTAQEAEEIAARERPDLITMDINIKGARDGVDAARLIYEKYGIRSVFVSAYGNPAQKVLAQAANPLGWVRKPIEQDDLGDILRQVMADRT